MIKQAVVDAINKQIQHEQANAHAYQAVAQYFERLNLHGFSAFMEKQVEDEREHADKLIAHLNDRGGKVELAQLPAPRNEFANPLEAVKHTLELERHTTQLIHQLYELANKEKDYGLKVLMHWYIEEQVEEEQWAEELTELTGQFHQSPGQLYMLDHHWGKRAKKD
jgi:ferritin